MGIFTTKGNVTTCVFNVQRHKPRFQLNKYGKVPSFTPFFNTRAPMNPFISIIERMRLNDRLHDNTSWCSANSVFHNSNNNKQSLFVYLGAFVFIGIMAWRYHCRFSLLIVGVANK